MWDLYLDFSIQKFKRGRAVKIPSGIDLSGLEPRGWELVVSFVVDGNSVHNKARKRCFNLSRTTQSGINLRMPQTNEEINY